MKNKEKNVKRIYKIINKLISKNTIKFNYYNSSIPLELLQVCYNNIEDTIQLSFRDIQKDYTDELKELFKKIINNELYYITLK